MKKLLGANESNGRLYLLIVLAVYLLLSLLYLLAVPTGESPDEPGHLQCIEQVSILGQLPEIEPWPEGNVWWARENIISGRMCYHMPLYYLAAGSLQKLVATFVPESIDYSFPPINQDFGSNAALFAHQSKTSFWRYSDPVHILALRLFSILLGGITVWASFALARRLLPRQPLIALLSGLLTAVWPQFVYLSRSLNNDGLATSLAVLILLVLLEVYRPNRFILAAFLAMLALITKLSVAFTLVTVLFVWGIEFWQSVSQRQQYIRVLTVCLGIYAIGFLAIYLTPTLWLHFNQGSGAFVNVSDAAREWSYWQQVLELTASSGWVRFGWMNVAAPQMHANIWWLVLLVTAVLGIINILRFSPNKAIYLQVSILVMWLLLVGLSYLQINLNRLQPQFRFMLAAVPILTTFSAAGWLYGFRRNGRLAKVCIVSIVVSLLFYNSWVISSIVRSAYHYW